jgi:hypothetical protein
MTFREAAPRQRVYILRFWETRSFPPDAPVTWRFSAQDPRTGERRGFADLEGLMAFLAAQTSDRTSSSHGGALPGSGSAVGHAADPADTTLPTDHPAKALRRNPANPWSADSAEQVAQADLRTEL